MKAMSARANCVTILAFLVLMFSMVGQAMAQSADDCAAADPAQGGFFKGIRNLSNGGYKCRLEQKQNELGAEQGKQNELVARAAALQEERDSLSAELARMDGRINELDKRISELRAQLANQKSPSTGALDKLNMLEDKAQQTRQDYQAVSANYHQESIDDARVDVEKIARQLDELDALAKELGS